MVSPWLEPYTQPVLDPNFDYTGDLGSPDTSMGDWYLEGIDRKEAAPFVRFTDNDYSKQWSKVDAVNGKGRTLFIYGEREYLRHGIENFIDVITNLATANYRFMLKKAESMNGMFYVVK